MGRWLRRLRFVGPRIWIVAAAVLAAWAASAVLAFFIDTTHQSIWSNFYAAWVQDVIFFSLVGIAVAVYTAPYRPDSATFAERIRAFYGSGAPPALMEYATKQLTRYGGFSPTANRTIVVHEYRETDPPEDEENGEVERAYRVEAHAQFKIVNLFHDVSYHDSAPLTIQPNERFKRPPHPFGRLEWVTVGSNDKLPHGPVEIDAKDGYRREVDIEIPEGGTIDYEYRFWVWTMVGELQELTPARVVQSYVTIVRNAMENKVLPLEVDGIEGAINLKPGEHYSFPVAEEATPEHDLFKFRLAAPLEI